MTDFATKTSSLQYVIHYGEFCKIKYHCMQYTTVCNCEDRPILVNIVRCGVPLSDMG